MTVSLRSTQGCFQWILGRVGGTQALGLGVKHRAGLGAAGLPSTWEQGWMSTGRQNRSLLTRGVAGGVGCRKPLGNKQKWFSSLVRISAGICLKTVTVCLWKDVRIPGEFEEERKPCQGSIQLPRRVGSQEGHHCPFPCVGMVPWTSTKSSIPAGPSLLIY